MKNLMKGSVLVLLLSLVLAACSGSEEQEEIISYHNDLTEFNDEVLNEIEEVLQQTETAATVEESYEIQKELPDLVGKMLTNLESKDPESESVKEYHDLRKKQITAWHEAMKLEVDILGQLANGEMTEEEANEASKEIDKLMVEFDELTQEVENKIVEFEEEYDIEFEEEEI
ncbi:hypothetical protein [Piscibacillus salipiscarius]|uniref:Lipoprotein n=1 Tax=Piscibacillus salipiscarius TaxID=299480 RepID=A0ABW5QAU1_9BACI|nr:hypothetical protein [Piscibacillus salipiscarius]